MIAGNGDPPPGKPLLPITSRGSQDPEYDMSFRALGWVDTVYLGKPGAKTCGIGATLMALAQFADEDNACWPRQTTLAARSRQSERTVRDNLEWLEQNGFIQRERRSSVDGRRTDLIVLMVGKFPLGTIMDPMQPANSTGCATGKIRSDEVQNLPVAVIHETVIETVSAREEQASPKHRKQRPQFQEPTLEEWMAFCREKWPWMTPMHAEQSWNHYHLGAVDGQWVQKDGTPIKSWRQCANTSHGLFIASNPDAKARYHRIQQTAARASESAQKPAESGWRNSPEWFAHVERCKAEGKSMQETLLTFVPGEKV